MCWHRTAIALAMIVCWTSVELSAEDVDTRQFTTAEWLEDLDYAVEAITTYHPNPYLQDLGGGLPIQGGPSAKRDRPGPD